mgnify:CR=1 FL=1
MRSIIIPYGSILIACFEVTSQHPLTRYSSTALQSPATSNATTSTGKRRSLDARTAQNYADAAEAAAAAQLLIGTAEHAAATAAAAQGNAIGAAALNGHQRGGWDASFGSNGSGPLDSLADATLAFDGLSEDEKRAKLEQLQDGTASNSVATLAAVAAAAAAQNKNCTSCGTANSPEWRKGPTGKKTVSSESRRTSTHEC